MVVLTPARATRALTAAPTPKTSGGEDLTSPSAAGGSALSRCVACSHDVFAAEYWGRAPLLTRAAELDENIDDLFDAAAVDELVSRRGLRTPFLRMAKDGNVLPTAKFTRGGGAGASIGDQAADDRVLAMIADGATLVLQALHRNWPPLMTFAAQLADELGHPAQINAYITPSQNQGFAPHYDVHDVFVLQVAGRKHWTMHSPVVTDPLADQPWENRRAEVCARAQEPPLIDTVLAPGDALYLPRGTIHAAQALGETSIHLTVGVHPVTRYQLVRHLLESAQADPELRTSLPVGTDLADPDVLAPSLAATIEALRRYLDSAPADEIARRVGTSLMRLTRPEPLAPLAQLAAADALDERTPLRLRTGLRLRVERDDTHVRIVLLDRTVELPLNADPAIKTVLAGAAFAPADLPGLDAAEQLTVATRLLREGVLVPA
ncbi:MAG: Cupin 4 family protein [Pseudonocardiales bacterium]|nr:Cupin 4 family protein [Pseudonocardiales bacterium]